MPGRPGGDGGSLIPMIIMAFGVAGLVITGTIAAGSAFLAQRDVQSVCDGAAIAAVQAINGDEFYVVGAPGGQYPLGKVQDAVAKYEAQAGSGVDLQAGLDGRAVVVACHERVHIAFGGVFGYGDGLDRNATAHAEPRQPTRS